MSLMRAMPVRAVSVNPGTRPPLTFAHGATIPFEGLTYRDMGDTAFWPRLTGSILCPQTDEIVSRPGDLAIGRTGPLARKQGLGSPIKIEQNVPVRL